MIPRPILFFVILALSSLPARAQSGGWQQLFNGKDLTGWQQAGPGKFVVENGMLKPVGGMGLLWYTRKKIANSILRVVYKVGHDDDNSGVFIRIPEKSTEEEMSINRGYEVQIYNDGDDYHCTGVLYSFTKALARPWKPPGEWNTMDITLDGPHTIVMLNGVKVTDFTEGQPVPPLDTRPLRGPRPDTGYIGLQNHMRSPKEGNGNKEDSAIYFKEVAVKKISH
jgi:hypothetical protein